MAKKRLKKSVSDNLEDKPQSIYSVDASKERRASIVAVKWR